MIKQVVFLKKVLRVRKAILRSNTGKKNPYQVINYMQEIEKYVDAYGSKYDEEYWKGFVNSRYEKIVFLIPGNASKHKSLTELNELT